ncbi:hypothetical protein [Marinobacter salarius]|uniref:hypothetical protein n=1 Tax=Marinobacter salarius TaxID=1420917 RepID=UPI003BABDB2A
MIQFLPMLKGIMFFAGKHWKLIGTALVVGAIVYTIYSQKLEISELASDLVTTKAQLENVKEQYVTQSELVKVRNEVATANQMIMEKVNAQNRQVTTSLNKIESDVRQTGSEVDKLQIQLHPSVSDFIDEEIRRRSYNE